MKEKETWWDFPVDHTRENWNNHEEQKWESEKRVGNFSGGGIRRTKKQGFIGQSPEILNDPVFGTLGKTAGSSGFMEYYLHTIKYFHCIHTSLIFKNGLSYALVEFSLLP